jgi:hypothetical protein
MGIRIPKFVVVFAVSVLTVLVIYLVYSRLDDRPAREESPLARPEAKTAFPRSDEYVAVDERFPEDDMDPVDDDHDDDPYDTADMDDEPVILAEDYEAIETDPEVLIGRLIQTGAQLIEETDLYAVFEIPDNDQELTVLIVEFLLENIGQPQEWMQAMGDRLIQSDDDPALRALGAVFHAVAQGELNENQIGALVRDTPMQMPLHAIIALEALGYWGAANSVSHALRTTYAENELRALINDPNIPDDVRRQALLMVGTSHPNDLMGLAVDSTQGTALRMAAVAKLASEESFDEQAFRQQAESSKDPALQRMIRDAVEWRNLTKDVPPEDLHTEEINKILDEDHSDVLMTLATLLRVHVGGDAANVHPETRRYLFETLDYYRNIPLTREQEFWLKAVEAFGK